MLSVSAASRKYQISGSVIERWRQKLAELYLEVDHLKKLRDWLRPRTKASVPP